MHHQNRGCNHQTCACTHRSVCHLDGNNTNSPWLQSTYSQSTMLRIHASHTASHLPHRTLSLLIFFCADSSPTAAQSSALRPTARLTPTWTTIPCPLLPQKAACASQDTHMQSTPYYLKTFLNQQHSTVATVILRNGKPKKKVPLFLATQRCSKLQNNLRYALDNDQLLFQSTVYLLTYSNIIL